MRGDFATKTVGVVAVLLLLVLQPFAHTVLPRRAAPVPSASRPGAQSLPRLLEGDTEAIVHCPGAKRVGTGLLAALGEIAGRIVDCDFETLTAAG